jgi:Ca2+-binding RTX toxin-like protein
MATNMGTSKPDKLIGTSFKDKLFGLGGNDKIKGMAGDDVIEGGKGNDKLWGGEGADTFVFKSGEGRDLVNDFDVTKDIIQIKGVKGISSIEDVLAHAKQKGNHVEIDLGKNDKITLKFVKLADLKKHPGDHFDIS